MDSVSTNRDLTEDPEPMLGVVPARMNWVHTWDEGNEIVELYLDRTRRDGCLVLCVGKRTDEQVGTFYWAGGGLQGVVWRGSATGRPQAWRDLQYGRVKGHLGY